MKRYALVERVDAALLCAASAARRLGDARLAASVRVAASTAEGEMAARPLSPRLAEPEAFRHGVTARAASEGRR